MKDVSLLHQMQASGITLEQSIKILSIISGVAKQKFPILEGTINSFLKKELSQVDSEMVEEILTYNSNC